MDRLRVAYSAAAAHSVITLAGSLAAAPNAGGMAFLIYTLLAPAVPPASVWAGAKLARTERAQTALAIVMVASACFAVITLIAVLLSAEPMAPILLLLFAIWNAIAMALMLLTFLFLRAGTPKSD